MKRRSIFLVVGLVGCNAIFGIEPLQPAPPCSDDASCSDDNVCTIDTCDIASGLCNFEVLDGVLAPEQVDGDCQRIACSLGTAESQTYNDDLPEDGSDCTDDLCNFGEPKNEYRAEGEACNTNGGRQCNDSGLCVDCLKDDECDDEYDSCIEGFCDCIPDTSCEGLCGPQQDSCGSLLDCDDDETNGDESDVDCGGDVAACPTRCAVGDYCMTGTDCESGACVEGDDGKKCTAGTFTLAINGSGNEIATDVAIDGDGNIYVVGWFDEELKLGSNTLTAKSAKDAFVVKLAPDGSLTWLQQFYDVSGISAMEEPLAVALADDGTVVVAGWFDDNIRFDETHSIATSGRDDAFVVALWGAGPLEGDVKWSTGLGGSLDSDDRATGVAIDEANAQVVVFGFHGEGFLAATPNQEGIYLARLRLDTGKIVRNTGQIAPVTVFEGREVYPERIEMDGSSALLIGSYEGEIDFGTNAQYYLNDLADIFLARIAPNGDKLWSQSVGDGEFGEEHFGYEIALAKPGTAYMTGSYASTESGFWIGSTQLAGENYATGMFVAKLDTNSDNPFVWAKGYLADSFSDAIDSPHVTVDSEGRVLLTFSFESVTVDGQLVKANNADTMLIALTPDGTAAYHQHYTDGSDGRSRPAGIAAYASGHVVIVGDYDGPPPDFKNGADALPTAMSTDIFVARVTPEP